MHLYTPNTLLYPITVTKLLRQPGDALDANAPLFVYNYNTTVSRYDKDQRENVDVESKGFSNFESEVEGTLSSLNVAVGQVLTRRSLVGEVEEACLHEIQFGGICANCGKDVTTTRSYNTTVKDTARATVNTVHACTELLISETEASRADTEAKHRLLDDRRLSLVVDLDQTIIHATVDPTVGEWQKDESNPNHQAVKDVRAFTLPDDGPGGRITWYYIKLRPGLARFLEEMSALYELHIYTMGTRAYAENIAKIIDPTRAIFGERVLSRDESGSSSFKKLERLFPVDTKMVVIIDDRADVWHWIPNLVKVPLYDFFVGIGDINGSFLPKRPAIEVTVSRAVQAAIDAKAAAAADGEGAGTSSGEGEAGSSEAASTPSTPPTVPETNGETSVVGQLVSMAGAQDAGSMKEKHDEQDQMLAAQQEDRPLLQKQKILEAAAGEEEEEEEEAETSPAASAAVELLASNGDASHPEQAPAVDATPQHSKYRHNLLQDDDTELTHLSASLRKIHAAYYAAYDAQRAAPAGSKGGRIAALRPGPSVKHPTKTDLAAIPDAAAITANLKSQVLAGVVLVFSGVIPTGMDIQTHDMVRWAKSFGAVVGESVTRKTTHVVATPERRTAKVRQAGRRGGGRVEIVGVGWLVGCFSQWRRVEEGPYRIHSHAAVNGAGGLPDSLGENLPLLSSSEEEAALTDEDPEDAATTVNGGAKLGLRVEIGGEADTEAESEFYAPSLERKDSSPIESEAAENWDDIDDELREFMGSEGEEESEAESVQSDRSAAGGRTPRKRKIGAVDSSAEGEGEEEEEGSRLQKRKRTALARTSSLTSVAAAVGDGPRAEVEREKPPDGVEEVEGGEDDDGEDGEDDDGEHDLEAALAAEMERQASEDAEGATTA